jgi:GAF domain-containing protein
MTQGEQLEPFSAASLDAPEFDAVLRNLAEEARDALAIPFVGISFFPKTTDFLAEQNLQNVVHLRSEHATCIAAVVKGGVFSVTEMHFHPQFSSNPFVTNAPFIRSYLGCAVLDRRTKPIGTFCAFDTVSRTFCVQDAQRMQGFAERAAEHIERLTFTRNLDDLPPNAKLLAAIDIAADFGYAEAAKHMISVLYASFDRGELLA